MYSSIYHEMNTFIKQILTSSLNIISVLTLVTISPLVSADIYQWRDSSGGIQFGNNPPKGNSTVSLISKQSSSNSSNSSSEAASTKITSGTKLAKSSIFRNSRRNNLLYQGEADTKKSRIISVRLLEESKNSLIFDVNYYLSEREDGSASIGITPNMDNWSSAYTKAHPGRHATTISLTFSNSGKSVVRSSSLKLSMALAKESGYVGPIFEHDLAFNKVWYKK